VRRVTKFRLCRWLARAAGAAAGVKLAAALAEYLRHLFFH
jgi:hypothetical protein